VYFDYKVCSWILKTRGEGEVEWGGGGGGGGIEIASRTKVSTNAKLPSSLVAAATNLLAGSSVL
jgi:hypothetical protein